MNSDLELQKRNEIKLPDARPPIRSHSPFKRFVVASIIVHTVGGAALIASRQNAENEKAQAALEVDFAEVAPVQSAPVEAPVIQQAPAQPEEVAAAPAPTPEPEAAVVAAPPPPKPAAKPKVAAKAVIPTTLPEKTTPTEEAKPAAPVIEEVAQESEVATEVAQQEQQAAAEAAAALAAQEEAQRQQELEAERAAQAAQVAEAKRMADEKAQADAEAAAAAAAAQAEAQRQAEAEAQAQAQALAEKNLNNGTDTQNAGPGVVSTEVRKLESLRQMPGNPRPQYSQQERLDGHKGIVNFQAFVTQDGQLTNFKMLQSSGYRNLDAKTLKALKQWKFHPGQQGWVELPFNWDLKGGPQELPALLRRKVGQGN